MALTRRFPVAVAVATIGLALIGCTPAEPAAAPDPTSSEVPAVACTEDTRVTPTADGEMIWCFLSGDADAPGGTDLPLDERGHIVVDGPDVPAEPCPGDGYPTPDRVGVAQECYLPGETNLPLDERGHIQWKLLDTN